MLVLFLFRSPIDRLSCPLSSDPVVHPLLHRECQRDAKVNSAVVEKEKTGEQYGRSYGRSIEGLSLGYDTCDTLGHIHILTCTNTNITLVFSMFVLFVFIPLSNNEYRVAVLGGEADRVVKNMVFAFLSVIFSLAFPLPLNQMHAYQLLTERHCMS